MNKSDEHAVLVVGIVLLLVFLYTGLMVANQLGVFDYVSLTN